MTTTEWALAAEAASESFRVLARTLAKSVTSIITFSRAAGIIPPEASSVPRGTVWRSPYSADKYRMVATRRRGPHWKLIGPTRERWWK